MKALNFNKNSWHYRLVTWLKLYEAPYQKDIWGDGKLYQMGDSADICTYSKKVAFALLMVSIGIAVFISISVIVIHTLLGIYFSVLAWQWLFSEYGNVGMISFGVGIVWFSLYMLFVKLADTKEKNSYKAKTPKPDSFLKNAYKSWKNKFCLPINFE